MMNKSEIKKALYKQNPKAIFNYIRKGIAYYKTSIMTDEQSITINFEVPIDDMGDADFYTEMDSKLLNRYIVE